MVRFCGRIPEKNEYRFGVIDDNKAEVVKFEIKDVTADLTNAQLFVKTASSSLVDEQEIQFRKTPKGIFASWELESKHTRQHLLEVQLVFKNAAKLIWQTEKMRFRFSPTINVDEAIEDNYPQVLRELQAEVIRLEIKKLDKDEVSVLPVISHVVRRDETGSILIPIATKDEHPVQYGQFKQVIENPILEITKI